MKTEHIKRSLFFPILLILVGGFLLLNQMNLLPGSAGDVLLRLWPLIFVVAGLDGLITQHRGFTGNILAIGLGVILLMGNFNYLNTSSWHVILSFWPLLIVAAGLDLIIGHRTWVSAVVGILVGLILVGGMFWLVVKPGVAQLPQSVTDVQQALESRTQARLEFRQAVGNLDLAKGADKTNLLQGQLHLVKGEQVNWSMTNNVFEMTAAGDATWMFTTLAPQSLWDLKVTDSIPLDLDFQSAVGTQTIDLNGLKISNLDVQTAVGELNLILPQNSSLTGSVQGAVGRTVITVPKGAAVNFITDTAVVSLSYPADFIRQGKTISSPGAAIAAQVMQIHISQAVGSVVIESGK